MPERVGDRHAHEADDGEAADEDEDVHDARRSSAIRRELADGLGLGLGEELLRHEALDHEQRVSAPPIGIGR
jgi:hypothetical protein